MDYMDNHICHKNCLEQKKRKVPDQNDTRGSFLSGTFLFAQTCFMHSHALCTVMQIIDLLKVYKRVKCTEYEAYAFLQ